MNLYRVILPVDDIEKATAFYALVFNMGGVRVSPGRHYFNLGETILACYDPAADGDAGGKGWRQHENQYLYFSVDALADIRQRVLKAGGEHITAIESMPWGEILFYARDPFGNPIAFVDASTVFRG